VRARRPGPDAGDVVWLEFDPRAGHEQGGHRPALVLSPKTYNVATGLMICCPMTTKSKGYPFGVAIAGKETSVVLSDQVKSLDWRARKARRKGTVSKAELAEVRGKLRALIG
jgi:mRNA interferase MazF